MGVSVGTTQPPTQLGDRVSLMDKEALQAAVVHTSYLFRSREKGAR